ncbi:tetratricopeptide repeat protein [Treponema sp. R6D11]
MRKKSFICFLSVFIFFFLSVFLNGCAGRAASAQEYYALGMAYYDLGKFYEAEKWLNRARQSDRTMTASTYNLGRIAYEMKRYEDAAKYFEAVLKRDKDNVLALKAAAYSRIKTGDIEIAEKHYAKLLTLVPESADDGYNHALVLFALERYAKAEEVLEKYSAGLLENKDTMLLYARCQAKLKKVEAIDSYSNYLSFNTDAKARYEYAQVLEDNSLYARALEEYRKALTEIAATAVNPQKCEVRFALARAMIIADGENAEGITELQNAVGEGFNDIPAVEKILTLKISAANKTSVQTIIGNMRKSATEQEKKETEKSDSSKTDS